MNKYETMFVLNANLDEEALTAAIDSINGILTSNGANVLDTAKWGKKELAYEIKKERYGYYVVTTFETDDAKVINEFNRLILINPVVLRHIVVNL